jgi:hypothetical protein
VIVFQSEISPLWLFFNLKKTKPELAPKTYQLLPFRSRRYQRVGGDARGPVGLGSDVEGRARRQHGLLGRTHADTGHPGLRSFKGRSRGLHKVVLDFLFFCGGRGSGFFILWNSKYNLWCDGGIETYQVLAKNGLLKVLTDVIFYWINGFFPENNLIQPKRSFFINEP